jgi:beta-phosphoglucomutase-like phosphatase (HAD superfamily)
MMENSSNWQAVFFDFDGVIADSTAVKVRAFTTLFSPFGPQIQERVVRYHLENGGMPRLEKLHYCYTAIVGQPVDATELTRQARVFSTLVRDEVVAAPFVNGALATLQSLRQSQTPCFVVSGTPDEEMRDIVERKGLSAYFTEVHGSPQSKSVIVADVVHRYRLSSERCLFIGDALADYRAAVDTGLHFLGIVAEGQPSIFPATVATSTTVRLI